MKCIVCGKEFEPVSGHQKMCSAECQAQRKRDKSHEAVEMRRAARTNRELTLRRNYAKKYCTGHLDKKLKECKKRGITYAQMQAEKYIAMSREERA